MNAVAAYILIWLWFGAFSAADAPVNQITAYHDLRIYEEYDAPLAKAILKRTQNHLWYASEELVVLSLASDKVSADEKREVADAVLASKKGQLKPRAIQMPPLTDGVRLKDRVCDQSLHFFSALSINPVFLEEPVETWTDIPAYQKFSAYVESLPITNDESERMVRRTVLYANFGPKADSDFQAQLQTVGDSMKRVPRCYTKKNLVEGFKKDQQS